MKTSVLFYGFLLVGLVAAATNCAQNQPPNLLSFAYVQWISDHPGGEKQASEEARMVHIALARELTQAGRHYYQLQQDSAAITKYEEALTHFATDSLYLYYGQSLHRSKRWEEAVKAYKIALALGYTRDPELYYALACAHSQLKHKDLAWEYLDLAMANGFDDLGGALKDSDLTFLRSQPEWARWLAERQAPPGAPLTEKGLVACYPFNGNAKDASGHGHHGLVFGASLTRDRFGRPNQAYQFDGVSNYIQLPKALALNLNDHDFTVSAWIKGDRYKDSGDEAIVGNDTGIDGGVLHLVVRDRKPFMGFYNNASKGHTQLSERTWYHLVFRYTAASQTQDIFLNGTLEASSAGHPPYNNGEEPLVIGRWASGHALGFSSYFQGTIDDVRFYDRPLSLQEIKALYQAKF